jgi:hypothetical protein
MPNGEITGAREDGENLRPIRTYAADVRVRLIAGFGEADSLI